MYHGRISRKFSVGIGVTSINRPFVVSFKEIPGFILKTLQTIPY